MRLILFILLYLTSCEAGVSFQGNAESEESKANETNEVKGAVSNVPNDVKKEVTAKDQKALQAPFVIDQSQITLEITVSNRLDISWSAATQDSTKAKDVKYSVCIATTSAAINDLNKCLLNSQQNTARTTTDNYLNIAELAEGTEYFVNVVATYKETTKVIYTESSITMVDIVPPIVGEFSLKHSINLADIFISWTQAEDNKTHKTDLEYMLCSAATSAELDSIAKCETKKVNGFTWSKDKLSYIDQAKVVGVNYFYAVVVKDADGNKNLYDSVSFKIDATFISSWTTSNGGVTADNKISLPLVSSGVYDFVVDWGDSTTNTITSWNDANAIHTYAVPGTYTVKITGTSLKGWSFKDPEGYSDSPKLINISNWGILNFDSTVAFFANATNLTITATDVPSFSGVTSWESAFEWCSSITTIPNISKWNMSQVTSFEKMFKSASSFNQDLGSWDTAKVVNLASTFESANLFNGKINNWDVSNVSDMTNTFKNASSFNQDLNNWDVSKVLKFNSTFESASLFNSNIDNWTISTIKSPRMTGMFKNATLFNRDISNWNVSNVDYFASMFEGAAVFNQNIGGWNVSPHQVFSSYGDQVSNMFKDAVAFDQNISSWSVGNVQDFSGFLEGATLSIVNYNALLTTWSTLNFQCPTIPDGDPEMPDIIQSIIFNAGNSKYTSADTARNNLKSRFCTYVGSFVDGGGAF